MAEDAGHPVWPRAGVEDPESIGFRTRSGSASSWLGSALKSRRARASAMGMVMGMGECIPSLPSYITASSDRHPLQILGGFTPSGLSSLAAPALFSSRPVLTHVANGCLLFSLYGMFTLSNFCFQKPGAEISREWLPPSAGICKVLPKSARRQA